MVYDCFIFFDEIDLLEIRLNILDPYIDKFVICEATETLMGERKKMYFEENKKRFEKFTNKIIHVVVETHKEKFANQYERERHQKNCVIDGLIGAEEEDIIIYSDVDEIPNPLVLDEIINNFEPTKIYHLAQRMFYFYINYEEVSHKLLAACGDFEGVKNAKWLGTKICSYQIAKKWTMDGLRDKGRIKEKESIRVENGGWHFSYMGGDHLNVYKRIKTKLQAFSHDEFNRPSVYNPVKVWLKIILGRDLLGRGAKFKKVKIDDSYPKWLKENYDKYLHFVL